MTRPTQLTNTRKAEFAFEVHAELLRAEAEKPELRQNPLWLMLRQDSFEAFYLALEKIS